MHPTFNDREQAMLRFLKAEFLVKGERPATMHSPAILNRDVKAHFKMAHSEYVEMMTRFQSLGIVDFNPHVMVDTATPNNGLLHVKPLVVEIVRQLDEEALRKKAEPPTTQPTMFNELEIRVLRFLENEFIEKGGEPDTLDGPAMYHTAVMAKFGLSSTDYRRLIARFRALRIVKPVAMDAENGYLEIQPSVVEIVHQLDQEALRKKVEPPPVPPPPPNRMDQLKAWAYSKWSIVILLILGGAIAAAVVFIGNLKTVLDWFGIKK
jgi:hypothetical protein